MSVLFEGSERHLDIFWYEEWEQVMSDNPLKHTHSKAVQREQKEKFLSGEIRNPAELDYPSLSEDKILKRREELLELKQKVINEPYEYATRWLPMTEEQHGAVVNAYRWHINEELARTGMAMATLKGDMRNYERYNRFIYGRPSRELFANAINSLREQATEELNSEHPEIVFYAQKLLNTYEGILVPEESGDLEEDENPKLVPLRIDEPTDEAFEFAKRELFAKVQGYEDRYYNADEIVLFFDEELDSINAKGWSSVKKKGGAITVSHRDKTIRVPSSREVTKNKMLKLGNHEVRVHVGRAVGKAGEYARSVMKMLGRGLDRNAKEEGIAMMMEQIVDEDLTIIGGIRGMMAVGYTLGLDGQEPRDFRDIYDLMIPYFEYQEIRKEKYRKRLAEEEDKTELLEEVEKVAANEAWKRAIRTFRGTDHNTPGVCNMMSALYHAGNVGIWEFVRRAMEVGREDELTNMFVGKFDPTNIRHRKILRDLGIYGNDFIDLTDEEANQKQQKDI